MIAEKCSRVTYEYVSEFLAPVKIDQFSAATLPGIFLNAMKISSER